MQVPGEHRRAVRAPCEAFFFERYVARLFSPCPLYLTHLHADAGTGWRSATAEEVIELSAARAHGAWVERLPEVLHPRYPLPRSFCLPLMSHLQVLKHDCPHCG